jgi:hypothetical protein
MSFLQRIARLTVALGLSGAALSACQSLAGIEDRNYVAAGAGEGGESAAEAGTAGIAGMAGMAGESAAGGGPDIGPTPACQDYCARIMALCTKPNEAYTDISTCLGICALFPTGDVIEKTGNTLACRVNQLAIQESPGAEANTLPEACARSGPGGNGVCGSNCESYCMLYKGACHADLPNLTDTQYDLAECADACNGLEDVGSYDTDRNSGGDTLQCRLYHTSAATVEPMTHCPHAQLAAQTGATDADSGPCTDHAKAAPDCDSFCNLERAECGDVNKVYDDLNQCLAVCQALPPGTNADKAENTVGCRKYHSYNAMFDADTHCSHTGPGGDGVCGSPALPATGATGNCESYCILAKKACSATVTGVDPASTFEAAFVDAAGCMKACVKVDGAGPNSGYSVAANGNNVQCRLLHSSRALTKPSECAAALGAASPCK